MGKRKGCSRWKDSKRLLVYKFRHVDPTVKYRSFSYAFLCSHNNFHNFWVFFPNCGGLDSGGASGDLHTIEDLISSVKVKVERKSLQSTPSKMRNEICSDLEKIDVKSDFVYCYVRISHCKNLVFIILYRIFFW